MVVLHQKNAGVSAARNCGIERASGDWILFLDGDDVYRKDILAILSDCAKRYPLSDGLRFNHVEFEGAAPVFSVEDAGIRVVDVSTMISPDTYDAFMWQWAYRRETLSDVRFDTSYHGMEDNVFSRQFLFTKAKNVVILSSVCHGYRQQPNSQVHRYPTMRTMRGEFNCRLDILRMAANCGKEIRGIESSWFMQNFFSKTFITATMARTEEEVAELYQLWFDNVAKLATMRGIPRRLRLSYGLSSCIHSRTLAFFLFSIVPGWMETVHDLIYESQVLSLLRKMVRYIRRRGEYSKEYVCPHRVVRTRQKPPRFFDGVHALRQMATRYVTNKAERFICFLVGGIDALPVGGYKVVYEYANRLADDGFDVTIVYPHCGRGNTYPGYFLKRPRKAIGLLAGFVGFGRGERIGGKWFNLDKRIKKMYVLQNSPRVAKRFPHGTKFIATYITTVEDLNLFNVPIENKFNFIQDYEAWFGTTPEQVDATYRYPMRKIAISEWLVEKVKAAGGQAAYVPNGLDFEYFKKEKPIENRRATEVAMLWHRDDRKRTEDAVAALKIVREKHADLHVNAFGAFERPTDLPNWITYFQRPDRETHNRIYNEAAIFVASSEQEGWGLCPCEAMICGASVACTDIGGYRSFAVNGKTALMSPARDVNALAVNICRLIEDDALRVKIATAGHMEIKQFTWERSFKLFKKALGVK